jgi:hypothetical protein
MPPTQPTLDPGCSIFDQPAHLFKAMARSPSGKLEDSFAAMAGLRIAASTPQMSMISCLIETSGIGAQGRSSFSWRHFSIAQAITGSSGESFANISASAVRSPTCPDCERVGARHRL